MARKLTHEYSLLNIHCNLKLYHFYYNLIITFIFIIIITVTKDFYSLTSQKKNPASYDSLIFDVNNLN